MLINKAGNGAERKAWARARAARLREGGRGRGRKPEKTTSALPPAPAPHPNDFATFNDRITPESHPSERVGSSDSIELMRRHEMLLMKGMGENVAIP